MFLSKSRSGVCQLYYKDPKGQRQKVSMRTTSKVGAVEFLRSFKVENSNATKPLTVRLQKFAEEFLEYAKATYSPLTRHSHAKEQAR